MLEEEKKQVLKAALDAQRSGLCRHKSGNFSLRDPLTGRIVITPSGIDRENLRIEQMCVLDPEGKLLEGEKPSSESRMHIECYRRRPDVHAVVHTHSIYATSFACAKREIPAFVYELAHFRLDQARIPVSPYERPGTAELAERVAETAERSDLILMERHGALALGKTLEEAYLGAQYMEEAAQMYLNVLILTGGKEPEAFTQAELDAWRYPSSLEKRQGGEEWSRQG